MLATTSTGLGNSIVDSIISSVTGKAVDAATIAAQPLLADVENRIKSALLPVVLFTAGSFLVGLLTYREVRRTRAGKALSGRRR